MPRGRPRKQTNQNQLQNQNLSSTDFSEETPKTTETETTNNNSEIFDKLSELGEDYQADKEIVETKHRKKGSGRKSKAEIEAEEQAKEFEMLFSNIGSMVFSIAIERLPNPKPLTTEEKQQLDIVTSRILTKYISVFGNYQDEVAFISVVSAIIIPRTNFLKKLFTSKVKQDVEKTTVN